MYTQVTIPNLKPGETGYQLDSTTGPYVAACCKITSDPVTQIVGCIINVRQVTSDGAAVNDATGKPIQAGYAYSVLATALQIAGGASGLASTTLAIALGEPTAVVDSETDIRDAMAVAAVVTDAFDLGSLSASATTATPS